MAGAPIFATKLTPYQQAQRFVGEVFELAGSKHDPFIQWCHAAVGLGSDRPDETAWCSSFASRMVWLSDGNLPRSKSAAARSWLEVGTPVRLDDAKPGFDVVILKRGSGPQPAADVKYLDGRWPQGHVAFFESLEGDRVVCVGGNQSDGVTRALYAVADVLGVRRLA